MAHFDGTHLWKGIHAACDDALKSCRDLRQKWLHLLESTPPQDVDELAKVRLALSQCEEHIASLERMAEIVPPTSPVLIDDEGVRNLNGTITGAYTCTDGRIFTYDAYWEVRGIHVHWRGHADFGANMHATSTEILREAGADPKATVRREIERWIEEGCLKHQPSRIRDKGTT